MVKRWGRSLDPIPVSYGPVDVTVFAFLLDCGELFAPAERIERFQVQVGKLDGLRDAGQGQRANLDATIDIKVIVGCGVFLRLREDDVLGGRDRELGKNG